MCIYSGYVTDTLLMIIRKHTQLIFHKKKLERKCENMENMCLDDPLSFKKSLRSFGFCFFILPPITAYLS